ncbi:hypothetical protein [Leeuwenhoekiella palythoae]|uniref:hypothetical protein n=1 Tax=Leeuwenhoekiella palythoae TaxID=573501 RepID=UPI003510E421
MKNNFNPDKNRRSQYAVKPLVIALLILVVFVTLSLRGRYNNDDTTYALLVNTSEHDSTKSKEAFKKVYTVLMHPRCMNCHPAGDIPLQGEDSHPHTMAPRRGEDGKGLYAMKCANCHQNENTPGPHRPPGNPLWHLPPADMKMVFEGKSARELALQLVDKTKNGNKSMADLIEHAEDTLVKAGWKPAEGLELPPMSHEEFKEAWITWIENGAYAPDETD